MPSNPYYAYIEFWIGEMNMTLLPPQHVQQFTHIRGIQNSINKFILVLFDETALLVEKQLMNGYMNLKFRYGYSNGISSPQYSGLVTQYDTDFSPGGAILTIEGVSESGGAFTNPRSYKYEGMRIDQIVRQIAQEEGWEIGDIEECMPVSDGSIPNRSFERNNQTAQVFITSELVPYAASKNGDMDYTLHLEDVNGKTYVYFCSATKAASNASTTYNYQFTWGSGDKDTQVISFNPEYSGTLCMLNGGATVDSSTIDRLTNQIMNMQFTSTDDPCRVVVAPKNNYSYKGATRYVGGSSFSFDEMKRIAAYMWYANANYPVNAEMEVVGNPKINAFDTVSVIMLNKDGLPHHSSGLYLIKEIEDDIVGGTFTTKLIMFRNGMNIGVDETGGINVTIQQDYSINSDSDLGYFGGMQSYIVSSGSDDIIRVARGEVGYVAPEDTSQVKYFTWLGRNLRGNWGAAFLSWCANEAGISSDVFPRTASFTELMEFFQQKNLWTYAKCRGGPDYEAKPGDLMFYTATREPDEDDNDKYPNAVYLVTSVSGGTVHVIEGSVRSGKVQDRSIINYNRDDQWNTLLGFASPAYQVVFGYTNNGGYSKGNSNEQTIFNFCVQVLGLNTAAACGVLANIESESGFRTDALGDSGTSYGICQWHNGRWTNLKNFCSSNGYDWKSLEGQLWYLKSELEGGESAVYPKLRAVSNDAQGAYQAGYDWCVTFERPNDKYNVGQRRGANARDNYYPKYRSYVPPSTIGASPGQVVQASGLGYTLNLHQLFLTNNNCYKSGKKITVKGIMVHSTGCNNPWLKRYVGPDDGLLGQGWGTHWNTPTPGGRSVCVHGFIGKLADGSIASYQTLPWDMYGWHAGGSANNTHVSFEICEDDTKSEEYFVKVYKEAVGLVAYLCKLYSLDPLADGVVICHSEGHARGTASNHGDVMHWFPKYGKNMDIFRADVAAAMKGGSTTVRPSAGLDWGHIAIVGNSLAYGLASAASKSLSFTKVGGTVDSSEVKKYTEIASNSGILMELGSNELHNGMTKENFITKMEGLINQYKSVYPSLKVFVISIPPVASGSNYNKNTSLNNSNINAWNIALASMCNRMNNVTFVDTTSHFSDSSFGSDGLHVANYGSWLSTIKSKIGF